MAETAERVLGSEVEQNGVKCGPHSRSASIDQCLPPERFLHSGEPIEDRSAPYPRGEGRRQADESLFRKRYEDHRQYYEGDEGGGCVGGGGMVARRGGQGQT